MTKEKMVCQTYLPDLWLYLLCASFPQTDWAAAQLQGPRLQLPPQNERGRALLLKTCSPANVRGVWKPVPENSVASLDEA